MVDQRTGVRRLVADLAAQSKIAFDAPLCVIGSAAHMLNGADVTPRDIDLLLPRAVSGSAFADLVLRPLGYADVGDFRWRHRSALDDRDRYPVDLSYPMERTDPNLFYACPGQGMSWDIDGRLLKRVPLDEGRSAAIPNECLAILLLIKSLSDKIFMIPDLASSEAEFWSELLRNDIENLQRLIPLYEQALLLEDMQDVIQLLPNNAPVRSQILAGCKFAQQALASLQPHSEARLVQIASLLRNYFDLAVARPDRPLPDSASLKKTSAGHNRTIYSCERTGAIYIDTKDADASEVLPFPLFVDIQLNASCNLKCAHCDYKMDGRTMSLAVLWERLTEMAAAGVHQVNFGEASEALLYEGLPSAIRMAAELKLTPNLTTNLTFEPSADLLDAIGACCGAVATSIDRFHFRNFPGDMMNHPITRRIRALVEEDVFVIVNTVYDRGDTEGVSCVLDYAERLGCRAVCLIRRFYDDGTTYQKLLLRDLGELLDQIAVRRGSPLRIGFHTCDPVMSILREPEGPRRNWLPPAITDARHTMFLDVGGAYRPTSFAKDEERIFGTATEAWNSEIFNRYRARSGGLMKLV